MLLARRFMVTIFCALGLTAGSYSAALAKEPVTIFAAASTTDALTAVIRSYAGTSAIPVRPVFAASSLLAQQISRGAPADLFLSANLAWMTHLAEGDLIDPAHQSQLLGNRLVLIAPTESTLDVVLAPGLDLAEALGSGRLVIGDPTHVPAGRYAKAALESLGAWEGLRSKLAFAGNVRAALALVARGEAAAGIVYASDAALSDRIRVIGHFPEASHPPIVYPLAVVAGRGRPEVTDFFDYLSSAKATAIFLRLGFQSAPAGG